MSKKTKQRILDALEDKKKKQITDYFGSWEGWYCEVEDTDGISCGEVIESDTGSLIEHLKRKHKINVELE
ncbi:hypothetical protein LCGC14_2851320 [marine sediment metagenome]|uniref:Uncharacterized protein n=1 Tax=marine sediment metagenome TaxID=412755 RepID=A0A0F9AZ74_9ZZZZ